MPYSACLLPRKVAIEIAGNFARIENSADWKLRVDFVGLLGVRVEFFMTRGYSVGKTLRTPGLDKEQLKIKWLQTTYNVKLTFTQKQIPTQNEKFNLFSSNKVSI